MPPRKTEPDPEPVSESPKSLIEQVAELLVVDADSVVSVVMRSSVNSDTVEVTYLPELLPSGIRDVVRKFRMVPIDEPVPSPPAGVRYMDLDEFRGLGYLQEANRQWFHPLGLALAVDIDDGGYVTGLGPIWDARDDPEGWRFDQADISEEKVAHVRRRQALAAVDRRDALGWVIQPAHGDSGDVTIPATLWSKLELLLEIVESDDDSLVSVEGAVFPLEPSEREWLEANTS